MLCCVILILLLYCCMHQIVVVYSDEFLGAEGAPGRKSITDLHYSMGTELHCSKMCMTGLTS